MYLEIRRRLCSVVIGTLWGSVCLLGAISPVGAQTKTSVIPPVKGERWWGGLVALGSQMPFSATTEWYDIGTEDRNNQIMPLLISSAGRYVWSEHPFQFRLLNDTVQIRSHFDDVQVNQGGSTLRDAYLTASRQKFPFTGQYPDSLFFVRPQYNTWIELMYNQNQDDVLKYAEAIIQNKMPSGVLMIDDNWQKYYGNFEFKPDRFQDPKAMVDRLHELGFKVMLWICPFVSADSPEYRWLAKKGYLVRNPDNDDPAVIKWWNGYSASYDLTNPEAFAYLEGQLKEVQQKYGIDGFKFDAGDVNHFRPKYRFYDKNADGSTFSKKWAELGLRFRYNEYRTAFNMGGQPLVQRLGDKFYAWKAVSLLIPDMIAAGLMGYTYTCPDMIGGGEFSSFLNIDPTAFDQELIVRSCQIHALMPMMQFSVAPWRILDAKHLDICRRYALLHEQMGDYILQTARNTARTGEPMVRSLEYMFPNQGFINCVDQFMLGDKYMVAPMVDKGYSRIVKLPKGKWRDDRGKVFKGPKTITIDVPIERLPYYERLK